MNNSQSLQYFVPEILLFLTGIIALSMTFSQNKKNSRTPARISLIGYFCTFIVLIFSTNQPIHGLFFNLTAYDPFSIFFKLIIIIFAIFISLLFIRYPSNDIKASPEYFFLMSMLVFGAFLTVSANHLLIIFISLEIIGFISFVLVGFENSKSPIVLKKYLPNLIASVIMLYGLSFLYGLTGSLTLTEIGQALKNNLNSIYPVILIFLFFIFGLGSKITVAPFHFWSVDIYRKIPASISALIMIIPKICGFALLSRFIVIGLNNSHFPIISKIDLKIFLAILSVITITFGNLFAANQKKISGILAYSMIAHSGFILLGFATLNRQGMAASVYYLITYCIALLGLLSIKSYLNNPKPIPNIKVPSRDSLFSKLAFIIFFLSLIGIPPLAGFMGKFSLIKILLEIKSNFYIIAFIAILNWAFMFFYYSKFLIHFLNSKTSFLSIEFKNKLHITILIILLSCLLFFGVFWRILYDLIQNSLYFFHI